MCSMLFRQKRIIKRVGLVSIQFITSISLLLLFCEYFIYNITIFSQCSWPIELDNPSTGLHAFFIADTHLLGPVKGHWFDKLRREWQMHRSFQTAVALFKPEVIFFLGDIFDEGQIVSKYYFNEYVERFHKVFPTSSNIKVYIVAGNHDMGFHYVISPNLRKRFDKAFNSTSVRRLLLKDVNFVLINSMAMEGDGCFLCKPAVEKIELISDELKCEQSKNSDSSSKLCKKNKNASESYSRPILLQHFPMYRQSDSICEQNEDSAPPNEKNIPFRPKLDSLSSFSSKFLIDKLNPRLILSGHTHHSCRVSHKLSDGSLIEEYSIPSFNWRNRNNPSFFLGVFRNDSYELSKCCIPKESTVIFFYVFFGMIIILWIVGILTLKRVISGLGGIILWNRFMPWSRSRTLSLSLYELGRLDTKSSLFSFTNDKDALI